MIKLPEPITREETFLAAAAGQSVTLPTPVTREELFLAKLAGEDVETPTPVTRKEMFLEAAAQGGGGGVTVEPLTVTENGTTTAPTGKAYSPVTVAVPQLGPAWTEFISATATTNIVESIEVLSQSLQAGKLYSVMIDKNASDYVANQLVALSTYNNGGDVTRWPTAFMRWKNASQGYNPQYTVSASYDATIQVGDKFFIFEV